MYYKLLICIRYIARIKDTIMGFNKCKNIKLELQLSNLVVHWTEHSQQI